MIPSLRPLRRRAATIGLLTFVLALTSCTINGAEAATPQRCDALRPGDEAAPTVVVAVDGESAASTAALAALQDRPGDVFGRTNLGFTAPDSDDEPSGVVMLVRYGPAGEVVPVGQFDLRGVGEDDVRRQANARLHATCLASAAEELRPVAAPAAPPVTAASAPDSTVVPAAPLGGDLLRALPRITEQVRSVADDEPAVIVATGLGRTHIAGNPLSVTDLRAEARPEVFARMEGSGLVLPDLAASGVGLVLLDPAEGIANSITATGVEGFATDLCGRLAAEPCLTPPTLA